MLAVVAPRLQQLELLRVLTISSRPGLPKQLSCVSERVHLLPQPYLQGLLTRRASWGGWVSGRAVALPVEHGRSKARWGYLCRRLSRVGRNEKRVGKGAALFSEDWDGRDNGGAVFVAFWEEVLKVSMVGGPWGLGRSHR